MSSQFKPGFCHESRILTTGPAGINFLFQSEYARSDAAAVYYASLYNLFILFYCSITIFILMLDRCTATTTLCLLKAPKRKSTLTFLMRDIAADLKENPTCSAKYL